MPDPSAAQGQRDPFADDVLERLARSNQDYQREHGHYIVPLAERLLAARADNVRLREEIRIREESQIPVIPHGAAVQLERLQVENEELRGRLKLACEPCAECGHIDYRELDDILEKR